MRVSKYILMLYVRMYARLCKTSVIHSLHDRSLNVYAGLLVFLVASLTGKALPRRRIFWPREINLLKILPEYTEHW